MPIWKSVKAWAIIFRPRGVIGGSRVVEVFDKEKDAKEKASQNERQFMVLTGTYEEEFEKLVKTSKHESHFKVISTVYRTRTKD